MPAVSYPVPEEYDGAMVKTFLRRGCGVSARLLARLKRVEGGITADGAPVRAVDFLRAGQTVRLRMPADTVRVEAADLPLSVVYEDGALLVVDKPPFLAVHPSAGHDGPTLAAAVVAHFQQEGAALAFRPVNRLDRNTSGLLLAAKNPHAAHRLGSGVPGGGTVEKEYRALVLGRLEGAGVIERPIRVRPGFGITREVVPPGTEGGRYCLTRWEALASSDALSLLRVRIETGRTHQIRVHMAWLGHPLAGDTMYGTDGTTLPRHALHCAAMRFLHPETGREIALTAPLPEDMASLLRERGWDAQPGRWGGWESREGWEG
ncbi:MAG TPA: RluA family pseudouridine synthase [Firmicutes bacterium]|nr:RluA family pseudouridine synthase [Bacillota bacterium]